MTKLSSLAIGTIFAVAANETPVEPPRKTVDIFEPLASAVPQIVDRVDDLLHGLPVVGGLLKDLQLYRRDPQIGPPPGFPASSPILEHVGNLVGGLLTSADVVLNNTINRMQQRHMCRNDSNVYPAIEGLQTARRGILDKINTTTLHLFNPESNTFNGTLHIRGEAAQELSQTAGTRAERYTQQA